MLDTDDHTMAAAHTAVTDSDPDVDFWHIPTETHARPVGGIDSHPT
jgi:hypothetical protein